MDAGDKWYNKLLYQFLPQISGCFRPQRAQQIASDLKSKGHFFFLGSRLEGRAEGQPGGSELAEKLEKAMSAIYLVHYGKIRVRGQLVGDSGWGCSLRATQMLLINMFKFKCSTPFKEKDFVDTFLDSNARSPFSTFGLQNSQFAKKIGQFFNFLEPISFFQQNLRDYNSKQALINLQIAVEDNCLYSDKWGNAVRFDVPLLLCVLLTYSPEIKQQLLQTASLGYFCGMLLGEKNRAYFCFGTDGEWLYCLDPHLIDGGCNVRRGEKTSYVRKSPERIENSVLLGFYFSNPNLEFPDFLEKMMSINIVDVKINELLLSELASLKTAFCTFTRNRSRAPGRESFVDDSKLY